MYRRASKTFRLFIPIIGISLLIVHGFESVLGFKVDLISAVLLLIALLPYLSSYIQKIKAGQVKVRFGNNNEGETILEMVKSLAEMRMLTYYEPREPESGLSDAHVALVSYLIKEHKDELRDELKVWLETGSNNIRWMASEIIGYHNMKEMEHHLTPYYNMKDCQEQWEDWKLNCIWAHSKIANSFKEMHDFLLTTKSYGNQHWLLVAYKQMVLKNHCDSNDFLQIVSKFLKRKDLSDSIIELAKTVLTIMKTHSEKESILKISKQ